MNVSRRDFIKLSTSAAVAGGVAGVSAAEAAPVLLAQAGPPIPMGFNPGDPALKYELVIAGGEVLDPSQNLRGRRDIGIKYGQIAAIAPDIPADRAVQRIDGAQLMADAAPVLPALHRHVEAEPEQQESEQCGADDSDIHALPPGPQTTEGKLARRDVVSQGAIGHCHGGTWQFDAVAFSRPNSPEFRSIAADCSAS